MIRSCRSQNGMRSSVNVGVNVKLLVIFLSLVFISQSHIDLVKINSVMVTFLVVEHHYLHTV